MPVQSILIARARRVLFTTLVRKATLKWNKLRAPVELLVVALGLTLAGSAGAVIPSAQDIQTSQIGDHALHVISPTVLELSLVNTADSNTGLVNMWDWVDSNQNFVAPNTSSVHVLVNGQAYPVSSVGFRRRPVYAPLLYWDLRIGNSLYLLLGSAIPTGASVQVTNDGALWPTAMLFSSVASPLRYSPAIHVNQEGYVPSFPKKAEVGYYLGNLGELALPTNIFFLVNAGTGSNAFQGTLSARQDVGYQYTPAPYQNVYDADFSSWTNAGEYYISVPGLGASLPFHIDNGIAMDFARTYAIGLFHQRSGVSVGMPYTRFTHAIDHTAPAAVPTNATPPFDFTWQTVSNYSGEINSDNPPQTSPVLTNYNAQLFPFINKPSASVSGGHFEAGDYNRVTYNGAQIIHTLMFAVDSLPGVASLDNLGIPESGDGISDALQEAKWEADFLAKMQDADGAFYYSVYPRDREYELDVLPENGDPQVVWPKNTATTAAAVAALAECASSPRFKLAYPTTALSYLTKAKLGWQFLTNALSHYGFDGAYQKIQHFDDDFTHKDELAWAACELYLATGDSKYQTQLFAWFPDPTDNSTFRFGWQRMYACYGNLIRDYAFAVSSGKLTSGQVSQGYVAKCINVITNCGNDTLGWSQDNAYGSSFPDLSKAYRGGGWYFSDDQAFDIVVAYQFNPNPAYLDAIVRNMNFEGGCNPVNAPYLTGMGWKRMQNVVDQYSLNDRCVLPKDGVPVSNINSGFQPTWVYQWELSGLVYPSDYIDNAPYPYYDRWGDDWNVSTEGSTTDSARSFAAIAWLAAQTPLATQHWTFTNATIIGPPAPRQPNIPMTLSLSVADPNMTAARITWEADGQQPSFGGQSFTFTPGPDSRAYWVEAEVQWPDGRRAFATNYVTVSSNAPPQLAFATKTDSEFSFTLAAAPFSACIIQTSSNLTSWMPLLTNTIPVSGLLSITDSPPAKTANRFYRAIRLP
jgi:hypothetical protein